MPLLGSKGCGLGLRRKSYGSCIVLLLRFDLSVVAL